MKRPPKAFWDAATKAIAEGGGAADPAKVAGNLWFNVMTPAQRRKWMKGERHHSAPELSSHELKGVQTAIRADRARGLLERTIDTADPQMLVLLAAFIGGWVGTDVADDLWAALNRRWNDFWVGIKFPGLPGLGGAGAFPDIFSSDLTGALPGVAVPGSFASVLEAPLSTTPVPLLVTVLASAWDLLLAAQSGGGSVGQSQVPPGGGG